MFERADRQGVLKLVGAKDARDGALKIHQDVDLYSTILSDGDEVFTHGSDPSLADTDGGGTDDGVEILVDGTDPNDPADDVSADDTDTDDGELRYEIFEER